MEDAFCAHCGSWRESSAYFESKGFRLMKNILDNWIHGYLHAFTVFLVKLHLNFKIQTKILLFVSLIRIIFKVLCFTVACPVVLTAPLPKLNVRRMRERDKRINWNVDTYRLFSLASSRTSYYPYTCDGLFNIRTYTSCVYYAVFQRFVFILDVFLTF